MRCAVVADDRKWILGGLPLLALLQLEVLGRGEVAGRDTWRCRAVPHDRPGEGDDVHDLVLHDLPAYGADEYSIDVDSQTGLILRVAGMFDGSEFSVTEVTDIAIDEAIDDERFVFESPDGSPVGWMRDLYGKPRLHLSASRLAELAGFRLFEPARVPDDWEVTFGFSEASSRSQSRARAMINLQSSDGVRHIRINERPAEADGPGTLVFVDSTDLAAAELLDLAVGMVPLRTDPPQFS